MWGMRVRGIRGVMDRQSSVIRVRRSENCRSDRRVKDQKMKELTVQVQESEQGR